MQSNHLPTVQEAIDRLDARKDAVHEAAVRFDSKLSLEENVLRATSELTGERARELVNLMHSGLDLDLDEVGTAANRQVAGYLGVLLLRAAEAPDDALNRLLMTALASAWADGLTVGVTLQQMRDEYDRVNRAA
jgi:hypothetical protein